MTNRKNDAPYLGDGLWNVPTPAQEEAAARAAGQEYKQRVLEQASVRAEQRRREEQGPVEETSTPGYRDPYHDTDDDKS